MTSSSPIFIVGMDRSGTTLMSVLVDAHPRIAVAPETWFINHWAVPNKHLDLDKPKDFLFFWRDFTEHHRFLTLGLDQSVLFEEIEKLQHRSFQSIFPLLLQAYADRFGKQRYGEKTPHHYQHIELIYDWFPDARVIFMLRDPRAVFASFRKTPFGHEWQDRHAREWRDSVRIIERWENDHRFKVVQYEELVVDPVTVLRDTCDFLDEIYSDEMLLRRSSRRRLEHLGGWLLENERRAIQPIFTEGIDRWRHELSEYKVCVIEHYAAKAMKNRGYQRAMARLRTRQFCRMHLGRIRRSIRYLGGRTLSLLSPSRTLLSLVSANFCYYSIT